MAVVKEISEIVAERRLYLETQPQLQISVRLGKPYSSIGPSNNEMAFCPYQIIGIGDEKVKAAAGIDGVQALQLAMQMIGAELYFKLNRQYGGKLRWDAGKEGDLGFPVPPGLEQEKDRAL